MRNARTSVAADGERMHRIHCQAEQFTDNALLAVTDQQPRQEFPQHTSS